MNLQNKIDKAIEKENQGEIKEAEKIYLNLIKIIQILN